jgi:hypothetical protein
LSKSSQKAVKKLSKVVKKLSKSCQKIVKVVKKFDPTFVPLNPAGHLWINGKTACRGKNWQKKAFFCPKAQLAKLPHSIHHRKT